MLVWRGTGDDVELPLARRSMNFTAWPETRDGEVAYSGFSVLHGVLSFSTPKTLTLRWWAPLAK